MQTDWLSAYPEVLSPISANPSDHDVCTRHASVWRNAEPYPTRRTDINGKIDSLLVDVRVPVRGEGSSGVIVQRDTITIFSLKLKSTAGAQNGQQQWTACHHLHIFGDYLHARTGQCMMHVAFTVCAIISCSSTVQPCRYWLVVEWYTIFQWCNIQSLYNHKDWQFFINVVTN